MNKELYVSSTPHETRLALVEDGETAEVYIEREKEFSLAGAIFKGRVTRVLPGMQSAFVDIGLERDAFLYVSDFFEDSEEYDRVVSEAENAVDRLESRGGRRDERPAPAEAPVRSAPPPEAPAEDAEIVVAPVGAAESAPPSAEREAPAPAPGAGPDDHGEGFRRHRRGRHRRRGGNSIPDAKFARPGAPDEPRTAAEASESAPPPAEAGASEPETPAARPGSPRPTASPVYAPLILPGESLAKYRGRPATAMPPPAPPRPPQASAVGPERHESEDAFAASNLASGYPEDLAPESDTRPEREVFERERSQPDSPRHEPAAAAVTPPAPVGDGGLRPLNGAPRHEASAPPERPAEAIEFADERNESEVPEEEDESLELESQAGSSAEGEEPIEAGAAPNAEQREQPRQSRMQARGRSRHRRRRNGREGESAAAAPASAPAPEVAETAERAPRRAAAPAPGGPRLIGDLLHAGQEILIQVSKEPLGKKGARITSHLALPGRYLVYMPTVRHIGVSRKIGSDEERARLKRIILENTRDLPGGFIVRTAGAGASDEEFKADIRLLANLWNDIRTQFEKSWAPATLHHDLNLVERTLRDQLSEEFSHIWVDTDEQYQRVVKFISYFMPQLVDRVRLYTRDVPLFEHYGIQEEIDKALKSKVWLKSGGYIVLNQTEALVAIDVNTGKFVGRSNRLEDTIVKTNVDAIREIVRQIRLRDLGGIIVIDFIDMDERRNRQRVMQALEEAMRADRAPSKVLSFNDFGLVALTRKRVKQSLERTLGCACPYCAGVGLVKSAITVCNEIYTEVRKVAPTIERDDIVLRVNPEIGRTLKAQGAARLRELEELTRKTVSVRPDPQVHQEQFEIY